MISAPHPPPAPPLRRGDDLAAVLRDAMVFQPGLPLNGEILLQQTKTLLSALEEQKIPHVLVGGLALIQYVDSRNTCGIDLILAVQDLPRLPGFVLREKNEWFGTGDCGPLRVDLRFTTNPLFAQVAKLHSQARRFLDQTLNCATPEGIILLKLFALPSLYRQGVIGRADLYETDILQLLRLDAVTDKTLLTQLQPHVSPTDLNALSQVLEDLRTRHSRAPRFQD